VGPTPNIPRDPRCSSGISDSEKKKSNSASCDATALQTACTAMQEPNFRFMVFCFAAARLQVQAACGCDPWGTLHGLNLIALMDHGPWLQL
jgi:hypothetical protein